ncbi:molybdenum cofactor guanylyltransferase [Leptothoe sp. ISB3NOV94-8A]
MNGDCDVNQSVHDGHRTAALVLAGGRSSRMGQDKALLTLPMAGQTGEALTLLQQTCSVAERCAAHTYVLTPWPAKYASRLTSTAILLKEEAAGAGPLVALAQGWSMILAQSQRRDQEIPDWLLLLACDMPALDTTTIQQWQEQLKTIDENAIATLPKAGDRWEPLCGFYHRRCIPSLNKALADNIRSFQRWLATETIVPLSLADSNMLRNCNTPGQWQQFLDFINARNP